MRDIDWCSNRFNEAENRKTNLEESMVARLKKEKNDRPFFVTDVDKMSRGTPMEQKRQTERIRRYFIGFIIVEKRVAWWDDASIRSRTTMLFDPDKARVKKKIDGRFNRKEKSKRDHWACYLLSLVFSFDASLCIERIAIRFNALRTAATVSLIRWKSDTIQKLK